jgi:hypothetical protein
MVQPLIEGFCIPKIQIHNSVLISELLYIWTLSITQYYKKLKNATFWKLDPFPSSGEEGGTYFAGSLRKSYPQSLVQLFPRDPIE